MALPPHSQWGKRYAWLLRQLASAAQAEGARLVVVEQNGSDTLAELPDGCERLALPSAKRVFERSRLINQAVACIECELLWIHSVELWLPFVPILQRLASFRGSLLKPFGHYFLLDSGQTELWLEGQSPQVGGLPQGTALGKASYVVDRELFLAAGGLNELFVGKADEGFELVRRLNAFRPHCETYSDLHGLWMHIPQTEEERRSREDNRELWRRLGKKMSKDLDAHLLTSLSRDPARTVAASRREAIRVIRPTPPPLQGQSLPGRLWALTTYFNPAGYASKMSNYQQFREGLQRAQVPLLTVELAFDQEDFQLQPHHADLLMQVRGADVLWQKERLLNLGLDRLPKECDKVAWLDADVLFQRHDWADRVGELLEQHPVVQPYSLSVRLRAGETGCDTDGLPVGSAEHEVLHSIAYGVWARGPGCLSKYYEHGHTGYAWAARRSLLQKHRFYEANILGNADLNMAQAMFAGADRLHLERLSQKAQQHLADWARRLYADVQGSVAHLDGWLYHLWHGNKEDRLYDRRLQVLVEQDYDPVNDLRIDPTSGAFRWNSGKPELQRWCRDYFSARREDDLDRSCPGCQP